MKSFLLISFLFILVSITWHTNVSPRKTWKNVIFPEFLSFDQCPVQRDACPKAIPYNTSKKTTKIDTVNTTEKEETPPEKAIESFDEWTKKRRDAVANQANGQTHNGKPTGDSSSSSIVRRSDERSTPIAGPTRNFASKECGAKVISANPESDNAKAIVNEKDVDDYMRNPCESAKEKFAVIELCEAIQIKKFAIGNFELFASRPKTVSVLISERYPPLANWISLGSFELQDHHKIMQTFEVPQTNVYAKFVRFNFEDHYGKEHYCVVSVVNVMGSTLADEYEKEEVAAMMNVIPESSEPVTTPSPSEQKMQTQLPVPPRIISKNKYTALSLSQLISTCNMCIPNQQITLLICYLMPQKSVKKALNELHETSMIQGFYENRTIPKFLFEQKRRRNLANMQRFLSEIMNNRKSAETVEEEKVEEPKVVQTATENGKNVKITEAKSESILPAGGSTNQREMVLMKLSKRIAAVEMNLTLSTEYLSELSKQYVSQMSGYQQELKETRKVSRESTKALEKFVRDNMKGFRRELRDIRQAIFVLQQLENDRYNNQVSFDMSRQIFMPSCPVSNRVEPSVTRLRQLEDGSERKDPLNFEQSFKHFMDQARSVVFGSISWNTDHLISILILSNIFALASLFSAVFYIHRRNSANCEETEEKMRIELKKRLSKAGIENRRMISRGLRRAELAVTAAVSSSLKSEKSSMNGKAIFELESALSNLFAVQQARIDEQFEENKNLLRVSLDKSRSSLNDTMSVEDSESSSETENTPTSSKVVSI